MSDDLMRPIYEMQQNHRANRGATEEIDAIDQVADHIEAQAARIAELEAALLSAKQHFVADEPLKAFVEICAALAGGKS